MTMTHSPTKIDRLDDNRIAITWSDGQRRTYTAATLRKHCPCASCREKNRSPEEAPLLPVLSAAETEPLRIAGMQPMGSYAYQIVFSDGHDTGIFTFERLRELGEEAAAS